MDAGTVAGVRVSLFERLSLLQGAWNCHNPGVVPAQERNRGPAGWATRFQSRTVPPEVFRPNIPSRVEKSNDLAAVWNKASNVWGP